MPDTWTTNPPMLREALQGLGAKCGKEARVLRPRDPAWTCYMDSNAWKGDIYIHPFNDLLWHSSFWFPLLLCGAGGLFIGLVWGRWFWKRRSS